MDIKKEIRRILENTVQPKDKWSFFIDVMIWTDKIGILIDNQYFTKVEAVISKRWVEVYTFLWTLMKTCSDIKNQDLQNEKHFVYKNRELTLIK